MEERSTGQTKFTDRKFCRGEDQGGQIYNFDNLDKILFIIFMCHPVCILEATVEEGARRGIWKEKRGLGQRNQSEWIDKRREETPIDLQA